MVPGITGVILAGGENRRFPVLKGFVKVGGSAIIENNLSLLKELFPEVLISTNTPEIYFYLGAPLIGDVLPSLGPMSGLYSSLLNAKSDCVFVVACDMPFISREVIALICSKHMEAAGNKSTAATIPVFNNAPQPLFGVYCKGIMPRLEEGILSGRSSLTRLLNEVGTNFVDWSDISTIDPDGRSFVNMNTLEDYNKLMADSSQPSAKKKEVHYVRPWDAGTGNCIGDHTHSVRGKKAAGSGQRDG